MICCGPTVTAIPLERSIKKLSTRRQQRWRQSLGPTFMALLEGLRESVTTYSRVAKQRINIRILQNMISGISLSLGLRTRI